jgi:hypothetical protein
VLAAPLWRFSVQKCANLITSSPGLVPRPFVPILRLMARSGSRRNGRPHAASSPYSLIVRGPDRRPRFERFANADSYKARLDALTTSNAASLTIDEVVGWLDAQPSKFWQSDEN